MDDEELEVLLRDVEALATSVGLGSLVEQEQAMARSGQTTEFAGSVEKGTPRVRAASYAPRKGEFRIMPLGVGQRLATILDLIEAAVVGGDLVEEAVQLSAKDLEEKEILASSDVSFDVPSESPNLLSFRNGETTAESERTAWSLQDLRSSERQKAVEAVADAIAQLRSRANLDRGDWLLEVAAERPSRRGWSK